MKPRIVNQHNPTFASQLAKLLQEEDPNSSEEPLNEAYDAAGILTAHFSQLLDLRLVAGPKPARAGKTPSNGIFHPSPQPEVQPSGSQQQVLQETFPHEPDSLDNELTTNTDKSEEAREETAAASTPPVETVPILLQQQAVQNGTVTGKITSISTAFITHSQPFNSSMQGIQSAIPKEDIKVLLVWIFENETLSFRMGMQAIRHELDVQYQGAPHPGSGLYPRCAGRLLPAPP